MHGMRYTTVFPIIKYVFLISSMWYSPLAYCRDNSTNTLIPQAFNGSKFVHSYRYCCYRFISGFLLCEKFLALYWPYLINDLIHFTYGGPQRI